MKIVPVLGAADRSRDHVLVASSGVRRRRRRRFSAERVVRGAVTVLTLCCALPTLAFLAAAVTVA